MFGYNDAECLILLASDSTGVRNHWKQALLPLNEVCETWTYDGLQRSLFSLKPSVLLLDGDLPGLNGAEEIVELLKLSTGTKIIMFTSYPDEKTQIRILRSGARGYCNKDVDHVLLRRAVEMVRKGEVWASRRTLARLLDEMSSTAPIGALAQAQQDRVDLQDDFPRQSPRALEMRFPMDRLTPREKEIAALVGSGRSNKEIASQLHISESTVKAHLTTIFRKLRVTDRLGLALFVVQQPNDLPD